jgi:hypothetical protein
MDKEIEGPGFTFKDLRNSQKPEEDLKKDEQGKSAGTKTVLPNMEFDFSTFILSLTSSAFYHLGDVADPQTGEKSVNLPAVKQTIDILLVLKEKTRGNLNKDEEKLLEQLIYELQIRYVEKNK